MKLLATFVFGLALGLALAQLLPESAPQSIAPLDAVVEPLVDTPPAASTVSEPALKREVEAAAPQRTASELPIEGGPPALTDSAWIAGQVVAESAGAPLGEGYVRATLVDREVRRNMAPYRVDTRFDEEGRFALRGLRPGGLYEVQAIAGPLGERAGMVGRLPHSALIKVVAPTSDLELSVLISGFSIDLVVPDGVDPGSLRGRVAVESSEGTVSNTGTIPPHLELRWPASKEFSITLEIEGMRPIVRENLILSPGEGIRPLRLVLEPLPEGSGVLVELLDPEGRPVEQASLWTYLRELNIPPFRSNRNGARSGPKRGLRTAPGGRFALEDVAPGGQWLRIEPGPDTDLLNDQVWIEVPEQGGLSVPVRLRRGGMVHLHMPSEPQDALRGLRARPVGTERWWFEQAIPLTGPTQTTTVLLPGQRYRMAAVFPPGAWEFRLGAELVVSASVRAGDVVQCEVPR